MAWFGEKKGMATTVANAFTFEKDDAEMATREAALERAAIAAEPEVLAKIPAENAANEAEHRRQLAGFKFECRRYGDFLTLFMERPIRVWNEPEFQQYKLSTSINIAATREIRLNAGHAPDFNGYVQYHIRNCYFINADGIREEEPPVRPEYDTAYEARRLLFALDEKHDRGNVMYSGPQHTRYRTANFPRPAADDSIRFEGIGATIYAPFGCGQAVYDAVLQEIEAYRDGAPTPARGKAAK